MCTLEYVQVLWYVHVAECVVCMCFYKLCHVGAGIGLFVDSKL